MNIPSFKIYLSRVPSWFFLYVLMAFAVMFVGCMMQPAALIKVMGLKPIDATSSTPHMLAYFLGHLIFKETVYQMFFSYAVALTLLLLAWIGVVWLLRRLEQNGARWAVQHAFWTGLAVPLTSLFGLAFLHGRWDYTPADPWLSLWQFWGGFSMLAALLWSAWLRYTLPSITFISRLRLKIIVLAVVWLAWLFSTWQWLPSSTAGASMLLPILMLWLLWPTAYRFFVVALGTVSAIFLLLLGTQFGFVFGSWLTNSILWTVLLMLMLLLWLLWSSAYRTLGLGLLAGVPLAGYVIFFGQGPAPNQVFSRISAMFWNSDPLGYNFQFQQASRALDHSQWWLGVDPQIWTYLPRAQDQYLLTTLSESLGLFHAVLVSLVVVSLLIVAIGRFIRASRHGNAKRVPVSLGLALGFMLLVQAMLAMLTGFAYFFVPLGMGLPFFTAHPGLALWAGALCGVLWTMLRRAPPLLNQRLN